MTGRRPSITVAIPYHSNLAYLDDAVRSVLAQGDPEWRLVVVDDAGPEPPDAVLADHRDERISWRRNARNLGLAGNWNECIDGADTEVVTLLHADDRLRPGYVRAVRDAFAAHPDAAAVFTDASVIGPSGLPQRSLPDAVKRHARRPPADHVVRGDGDLAAVLANNYVFCPTLCFRRAAIGPAPFDTARRMVMDLDLVTRLLLAGEHLWAVRGDPLYEYRRHASNQTSQLSAASTRFEEEIDLYRSLAERAAEQGWPRTARAARHRWMVRANLAYTAVVEATHRQWAPARRKISLLAGDVRPGASRPGHD